MKKSRRATILLIVISVVSVLIAATSVALAWLATNRQTASNEMEMSIEVSPNLVISDSISDLRSFTASGWANTYIVKRWSDNASILVPVDHYDSTKYPLVTGTNTFNLVYNSNPVNVSRSTGKKLDDASDLTFAHVPSDGEGTYFIDKTVYIASLDKTMTLGVDYASLSFSIEESESESGTEINPAYKSASVDVYVNGTYKNTLNLDTLNSFSISDIATVPSHSQTPLTVVFRCYFDGALLNASDNAYVNSSGLSTNTTDITFGITITATKF